MDNNIEDLFGEPISVYTDEQALEDGVLVAVTEQDVNRVTRAVFDHFAKPADDSPEPVYDLTPLLEAIRHIRRLTPKDGWRTGEYQGVMLWLIPNEVGGLTLMFPEDY